MTTFINCEICGKHLIERKENGELHFRFGKSETSEAPVELFIYGTVKIKCIRKSCGHWNSINKFGDSSNGNDKHKGISREAN